MDSELKTAITSAHEAQKRAQSELDSEIEAARGHVRAANFTSDVREIEALNHLMGLLQARDWWRKNLK